MATTATTQLLENGPRNVVYKFTAIGDTDESGVAKVDPTSAGPLGNKDRGLVIYPGLHLALTQVSFSVSPGCTLRMLWDADTDVDLLLLNGVGRWPFLDSRGGFGGITSPAATGATGIIRFTTFGLATAAPAAGVGYTVVMKFNKGILGAP